MRIRVPFLARRAALATGASALLAACSPTQMLNALVPDGTYDLTADIAYGEGPRRRLDVYRPRGADVAVSRPIVVFFYGGSWQNGDRGDYRFVGEALAAMGVVAVLPDYRVFPEVRHPDFVEDGAAAVRWALANAARFGADPKRLVVMGHSAGAHIASMLTLDRSFYITYHPPHPDPLPCRPEAGRMIDVARLRRDGEREGRKTYPLGSYGFRSLQPRTNSSNSESDCRGSTILRVTY